VLWRIEAPLNLGVKWAIVFAFITSLVFSVTNYIFGLHRVEWRRASWQYVFPLWFSSLVATGGLLVADRLLLRNFLPDLMVAMAGAFSFLGFTVLRYRDRLITGAASRWINLRNPARTLGEHILVVGAGENFSLATWLLSRNEYSAAYTIIGILDDDPRKKGSVIEGHRVLGNTKDIPNLVSKLDVGVILFTIDNINATERQRILDLCRQTTAHIVLLPEAIDHFRTQMRKGFNQDLTVEMDGNGHHPDLQPISPAEVRDWIDQLGNLAEEGDIQTLRQRLDSLKQELNQKTTFE
jgi:FlaA1/EpsC-like NDP-sugar epimerase